MHNKRGMSPIIATIMLVAFVVAVGVSFVSFAGSYVEQKSGNKTSACKEYALDFFQLDKTKQICVSKFEAPFSIKFWSSNKPKTDTECYVNVASGTSKICNAEGVITEKAWTPSKDSNI